MRQKSLVCKELSKFKVCRTVSCKVDAAIRHPARTCSRCSDKSEFMGDYHTAPAKLHCSTCNRYAPVLNPKRLLLHLSSMPWKSTCITRFSVHPGGCFGCTVFRGKTTKKKDERRLWGWGERERDGREKEGGRKGADRKLFLLVANGIK